MGVRAACRWKPCQGSEGGRWETSRSRRLVRLLVAFVAVAVSGETLTGATSLIDAAKRGDTAMVRTLLAGADANVDASEPDGTTALHWASYHDDIESADLLIAAGRR